eukprot:Sspe_Gene.6071::Locus_2034_Transcript_2_2_Confidence_0.667_Length_1869::g.6071::m.6071/K01137/GNS; N-acetylglucosamine-6-sulfatase
MVAHLLPLLAILAVGVECSPPNFFVLLTDDEDILLTGVEPIPTVEAVTVKGGGRFTNFFAHTPVCCPSRAQTLSGRYFHNIRMDNPDDLGCMHVNASTEFEDHTLATYLHEAGYSTAMFGKYLNSGGMTGLCPTETEAAKVPKGWDRFLAMCPDTCYTDCVFSDQGKYRRFDDPSFPMGSNYATSVMTNATYQWLEANNQSDKPFFVYLAPHAPHQPATPAPWYKGAVWNTSRKAPRNKPYGVHAGDHNWMVATQPSISESEESDWDELYRDRMRTLLSVDDGFKAIHDLLVRQGRADNTYFIYTSDHGFHIGQYNLGPCKRTMYRTDVLIPFFMAGPGIPPGTTFPAIAGLPDVAPTILDLAGVDIPSRMDGKSLAGVLAGKQPATWRDAYLVEYYATSIDKPNYGGRHIKDAPNNTFIALYSNDLAYAEYTNVHDWDFANVTWHELYNLTSDPWQLHNIYNDVPQALRDHLHSRLWKEWTCKGESCE